MAAATSDVVTPRRDDAFMPHPDSYPVAADTVIYQGTLFVINSSGLAVPCETGDDLAFAMIAVDNANNAGGAAGAVNVRGEFGASYLLAVDTTVVTRVHIGTVVYGLDDQTVTLTSTDNTPIGPISYFENASEAWVFVKGPIQ